MTDVKVSKKIQQLLLDLNSTNSAKATTALDALQVYGNQNIIKPLLEFLTTSKQEQTKKEVLEFLSSLKDTASKNKIIFYLLAEEFSSIQNQLLSTIWNSPLDYSEYLNEFVKLAVEKDYLTTLECLTIIENLEGPFEEKSILESQLSLKDYLEGKFSKSAEKDVLISEIALLIKDFDRDNQEFD